MSTKDPISEDVNGAANQILYLSLSKIWTSNNCANKKAVKITDVQDLGDVMINQLTDLFSDNTFH